MKILSIIVICCAFLIGFSYYFSHGPKETIRIGLNSWPGYEFVYLAKKKELYEKQGLSVDIIQYDSLDDVRYALEKDQIDIMCSTLTEVALSNSRTKTNAQAFFITDFSHGGDVILSESKDIRGKNVGVEPQSIGLYMLARYLDINELTLNDISVIGTNPIDMQNSMIKGKISVAITYPPFSTNMMKSIPNLKDIFNSSEIPGEVVDVLSAPKKFIEKNKEKLKLIIKAWNEALRYANSNQKESFKIMADREGILAEEFEAVLNNLKVLTSKEQYKYFHEEKTILKSANLTIKVLKKMDLMEKDIMPEDIINYDVIDF